MGLFLARLRYLLSSVLESVFAAAVVDRCVAERAKTSQAADSGFRTSAWELLGLRCWCGSGGRSRGWRWGGRRCWNRYLGVGNVATLLSVVFDGAVTTEAGSVFKYCAISR